MNHVDPSSFSLVLRNQGGFSSYQANVTNINYGLSAYENRKLLRKVNFNISSLQIKVMQGTEFSKKAAKIRLALVFDNAALEVLGDLASGTLDQGSARFLFEQSLEKNLGFYFQPGSYIIPGMNSTVPSKNLTFEVPGFPFGHN